MAKPHSSFRLDSRCYSILASVRDENLLPSLNAALNFIVQDYRRIREALSRVAGAELKAERVPAQHSMHFNVKLGVTRNSARL